MPVDTIPDILTIDDLARALRCSTKTIRRRLAVGTFPIRPLPAIHSRPRWSGEDVRQFLLHRPARRLRRVG